MMCYLWPSVIAAICSLKDYELECQLSWIYLIQCALIDFCGLLMYKLIANTIKHMTNEKFWHKKVWNPAKDLKSKLFEMAAMPFPCNGCGT